MNSTFHLKILILVQVSLKNILSFYSEFMSANTVVLSSNVNCK